MSSWIWFAQMCKWGATTSRTISCCRHLEEIRNASPLAAVLPHDVMSHDTLVATTVFAGTEDDRAVS